jgi:protoporphyrin/coproporphyrin ferrochelatase
MKDGSTKCKERSRLACSTVRMLWVIDQLSWRAKMLYWKRVTSQEKLAPDHSGVRIAGSRRRQAGVLLLAHGAPDRLEDIPKFLLNVRGGRKLPDAAVRAISDRYAKIGGGSPLLKLTKLQAAKLETLLNVTSGSPEAASDAQPIPVAVGMRNWRPFISEAIRELRGAGIDKVVAVCMAPQNSSTSVGLYRKRLDESIIENAPGIQVDFVESWHDHPGLIAALADKLQRELSCAESEGREHVRVVFTAHSVPQKTLDAGDTYKAQVEETAGLVAKSIGLSDWRLAFQSQGMTDEEWLGPTVESELDRLASEGSRYVLIAPIGFVSDHVEILYDIDVVFRDYGLKKGLKVWRTESLNDSPLFIGALASLVKARI